jgi:hypothetical protein
LQVQETLNPAPDLAIMTDIAALLPWLRGANSPSTDDHMLMALDRLIGILNDVSLLLRNFKSAGPVLSCLLENKNVDPNADMSDIDDLYATLILLLHPQAKRLFSNDSSNSSYSCTSAIPRLIHEDAGQTLFQGLEYIHLESVRWLSLSEICPFLLLPQLKSLKMQEIEEDWSALTATGRQDRMAAWNQPLLTEHAYKWPANTQSPLKRLVLQNSLIPPEAFSELLVHIESLESLELEFQSNDYRPSVLGEQEDATGNSGLEDLTMDQVVTCSLRRFQNVHARSRFWGSIPPPIKLTKFVDSISEHQGAKSLKHLALSIVPASKSTDESDIDPDAVPVMEPVEGVADLKGLAGLTHIEINIGLLEPSNLSIKLANPSGSLEMHHKVLYVPRSLALLLPPSVVVARLIINSMHTTILDGLFGDIPNQTFHVPALRRIHVRFTTSYITKDRCTSQKDWEDHYTLDKWIKPLRAVGIELAFEDLVTTGSKKCIEYEVYE